MAVTARLSLFIIITKVSTSLCGRLGVKIRIFRLEGLNLNFIVNKFFW